MRFVNRPLLALALATLSSAAIPTRGDETVRRLVDQIARGDDVESAEATDRLIRRLVDPLADAIGSLDARPAAEQLRLRRAVSRIAAALRIRLFQADLPDVDRKLFDAFRAHYDELVWQLFDDSAEVRLAAVNQIPLERDGGSGVLIAARVNDEDETVAEAALSMALKLHDDVVARGLTRYVRDATTALRGGFFKPEQNDIAIGVARFVGKSIVALGEAQAAASVPDIAAAMNYLAASPYWPDRQIVAECALALGKIGDERASAALIPLLRDATVYRSLATESGKLITQTNGDAALLSLARLYRIAPEALGLTVLTRAENFAGFPDQAARDAAARAFKTWHDENAARPPEKRTAPTSRPAVSGGG